MGQPNLFKWRHFQGEIILLCVRWYLRYPLSYRDLEEMMLDRGLKVDHSTINRWVQRYGPELDERCGKHLRKEEKLLSKDCALRTVKYLNNIIEQDHRLLKRLIKPGLGFASFDTAWKTLRGYEAMHMIRKGQVKGIGKKDIEGQVKFVERLFGLAA